MVCLQFRRRTEEVEALSNGGNVGITANGSFAKVSIAAKSPCKIYLIQPQIGKGTFTNSGSRDGDTTGSTAPKQSNRRQQQREQIQEEHQQMEKEEATQNNTQRPATNKKEEHIEEEIHHPFPEGVAATCGRGAGGAT
jgi:flagellar motor protein MotB